MNDGQDDGPGFVPPDGEPRPDEGLAGRSDTPRGGPEGHEAPGGPASYGDGTLPGPYGAPGPWPYGPGPRPPKKNRRGLIIGLVIVAGVVVAAVPLLLAEAGSLDAPHEVHAIVVPDTFGHYRRKTGSDAQRIEKTMRQDMAPHGGAFTHARTAIYQRRGSTEPPVVFIGLSAKDAPAVARQLRSATPSEQVDWVFEPMGIKGRTKDYTAGPFGGVLRCGRGRDEDGTMVVCAWADGSTLGMVFRSGYRSVKSLAGVTYELRNAAEH
ncbi:hypothetical protein [Actinoallomurus iriomotensis]|uniref:hypothetical protein n=1 Tax=Actinoallomurus iriomotensis TaxID=478107 RepID=UPI00255543BB|nr:hypothetical protein [Actinoallomurus iriomotensis]